MTQPLFQISFHKVAFTETQPQWACFLITVRKSKLGTFPLKGLERLCSILGWRVVGVVVTRNKTFLSFLQKINKQNLGRRNGERVSGYFYHLARCNRSLISAGTVHVSSLEVETTDRSPDQSHELNAHLS